MLLREAPWVFDLEAAYSMVVADGGAGLGLLSLSQFAQSAFRLIGSELARHRTERLDQMRAEQDAKHAAAMVRRG